MNKELYLEFYNDVFGPLMQPGSGQSPTAAPNRPASAPAAVVRPAVTEMAAGTPEQVENAASLSLQAATGIPCDPIPGGFYQPCCSRILTAVCMASVFADLALAGRQAVLPLHEAIDLIDAVDGSCPVSCYALLWAARQPRLPPSGWL